ncbi:Uncharacterised protein [Mycobacteroides abscessus subsp. abscessus]|nr:Uncharacterised protein [Mycobacteroides abscessus subsp. abscessus]
MTEVKTQVAKLRSAASSEPMSSALRAELGSHLSVRESIIS